MIFWKFSRCYFSVYIFQGIKSFSLGISQFFYYTDSSLIGLIAYWSYWFNYLIFYRNLVKLFPGCYSCGCLVKANLCNEQLAALNDLLPGAAVNVNDSWSFNKIIYEKQMFYSQNCRRVKKRNSYTVIYTAPNGKKSCGCIAHFLKVVLVNQDNQSHYLAAIKELQPYEDEAILSGVTISTNSVELGGHLKPYKYDR